MSGLDWRLCRFPWPTVVRRQWHTYSSHWLLHLWGLGAAHGPLLLSILHASVLQSLHSSIRFQVHNPPILSLFKSQSLVSHRRINVSRSGQSGPSQFCNPWWHQLQLRLWRHPLQTQTRFMRQLKLHRSQLLEQVTNAKLQALPLNLHSYKETPIKRVSQIA